jgi:hypothetical protein
MTSWYDSPEDRSVNNLYMACWCFYVYLIRLVNAMYLRSFSRTINKNIFVVRIPGTYFCFLLLRVWGSFDVEKGNILFQSLTKLRRILYENGTSDMAHYTVSGHPVLVTNEIKIVYRTVLILLLLPCCVPSSGWFALLPTDSALCVLFTQQLLETQFYSF